MEALVVQEHSYNTEFYMIIVKIGSETKRIASQLKKHDATLIAKALNNFSETLTLNNWRMAELRFQEKIINSEHFVQ